MADDRQLFWEWFVAGYRRLAADGESWASITQERRGEETALVDGQA